MWRTRPLLPSIAHTSSKLWPLIPRIRFRIRQSVRFPGFAKPWKEIRLDSLGSYVRGVSHMPGTDLRDRAAFRNSISHRVRFPWGRDPLPWANEPSSTPWADDSRPPQTIVGLVSCHGLTTYHFSLSLVIIAEFKHRLLTVSITNELRPAL